MKEGSVLVPEAYSQAYQGMIPRVYDLDGEDFCKGVYRITELAKKRGLDEVFVTQGSIRLLIKVSTDQESSYASGMA